MELVYKLDEEKDELESLSIIDPRTRVGNGSIFTILSRKTTRTGTEVSITRQNTTRTQENVAIRNPILPRRLTLHHCNIWNRSDNNWLWEKQGTSLRTKKEEWDWHYRAVTFHNWDLWNLVCIDNSKSRFPPAYNWTIFFLYCQWTFRSLLTCHHSCRCQESRRRLDYLWMEIHRASLLVGLQFFSTCRLLTGWTRVGCWAQAHQGIVHHDTSVQWPLISFSNQTNPSHYLRSSILAIVWIIRTTDH